MIAYVAEDDRALTAAGPSMLDGMDLMSPYVWRQDGRYHALVRAVPAPLGPNDPTGLIVAGVGDDGLAFAWEDRPAIAPGAAGAADAGGCEDPTVVAGGDGGLLVYYTGVDAARAQGSLIVATGPSLDRLHSRRVALEAPPGEGNIKEATVVQAADGSWRLFYEYAANDASRIGIASADSLEGPWTPLADPFGVRDGAWDDWHLSTGPIACLPGADPVMFYNGATRDARWRIGWVSFDPGYTRVTGRGLAPVILPPPPSDRSATDIGFAASAIVEDGAISLYYSIEDRLLRRARVRLMTAASL